MVMKNNVQFSHKKNSILDLVFDLTFFKGNLFVNAHPTTTRCYQTILQIAKMRGVSATVDQTVKQDGHQRTRFLKFWRFCRRRS